MVYYSLIPANSLSKNGKQVQFIINSLTSIQTITNRLQIDELPTDVSSSFLSLSTFNMSLREIDPAGSIKK